MSEIVLDHIAKSYQGKDYAVSDINLHIRDGEFIIFVGPSGCGKSTTLRMIAGLEEITEGELIINGERANDQSPAERDLAMVFQDFALYPNMNVYKNLMYPLKMHKIDKKTAEAKIKEVSQLLGLDDLLHRKPSQLSGGQKQRVALGRAIVREPNAFLMDEPLSNLDAKLRVDMRYEISQLHNKLGSTVIYVTHDQTEAMTMGDRIVVMSDGAIQQVGTPNEIYDTPANVFVAEFIGTPKINMFDRQIKDNRLIWSDQQSISYSDRPLPDQAVKVGVRPENLRLVDGQDYRVELIENLGSEKYIFLEGDGRQVIARVNYDDSVAVGEQFNLEIIQAERVNVFAADTGQTLELESVRM